ncbi:MAG: histidine phosphatase family protein [Bacteroidota bacterium]
MSILPMKFLFLVRHAKSSWNDAAMADFDRPLNARGIRDAAEMGRRLLVRVSNIDAFVCSPAQRARTTAEKFSETFGKDKNEIVFEKGLYLAPESFFNQLICKFDNHLHSVALFSHNPGITYFANTLTTAIQTDNIPTSGIFAVKALTDNWEHFLTAEKEFLFYDYPKRER